MASRWLAYWGRGGTRSPLSRLDAEVSSEKPRHVLFRDGPAEQIALRLRDRAQRFNHSQLLGGLDAFDQHAHAEPAAHGRNALHQDGRAFLQAKPHGEGTVDLDAVQRKAQEIAQARIAGAKIVERNAHALSA